MQHSVCPKESLRAWLGAVGEIACLMCLVQSSPGSTNRSHARNRINWMPGQGTLPPDAASPTIRLAERPDMLPVALPLQATPEEEKKGQGMSGAEESDDCAVCVAEGGTEDYLSVLFPTRLARSINRIKEHIFPSPFDLNTLALLCPSSFRIILALALGTIRAPIASPPPTLVGYSLPVSLSLSASMWRLSHIEADRLFRPLTL